MCSLLTFLPQREVCRPPGLALNGGNKPGELGLLALHQLLAKLILRLKGLLSAGSPPGSQHTRPC